MEQAAYVSIIVPIYNQEAYLDISIPSLIDQSYKNLQIILVNDGSTDTSPQILRHYAAQDSRIVIVEKENGGLVDATLAGISVADGEYLCFCDPDDLVGKNFVRTFVENMTDACDFVAAGYYTENKGILTPYPLTEDRIYTSEELRSYANCFLFEPGEATGVSRRFFISRWNKLYRTKLIKTVAEKFSQFRHISLGEDSIFTYLILNHSRCGRTLSHPNSYFYNIGNINSMMKTGQMETYLSRANAAFAALKELTLVYSSDDSQAYALYGFLIDALVDRIQKSSGSQCHNLRQKLRSDKTYQEARSLINGATSGINRIKYSITQISPGLLKFLKQTVPWLRTKKDHLLFWCKKCKEKGPVRASRLLRFQKDRENAFTQMKRLLPEMDQRIYPILKPYLLETSDLDQCPLKKNIFVFWWDGFVDAPTSVLLCLASIQKYHPDCCIIPIDKNNFKNYSDIHPQILEAFYADKISIQTFSDILRFNLLKNNGGVWIDATILFSGKFDLLKDLDNKSFTTLAFATSQDFLQYGENVCSWSGFLIASRKNSLFVRAIDAVFQQYFLKYRTYSTYFFIDITMMICKKYRLDGSVLDTPLYTPRNMFTLAPMLHKSFDANIWEYIGAIPQKLSWNISNITTDNSFYHWLLSQYSLK